MTNERQRRRVVITGVGAVTPLGVGARRLHERWLDGRCGVEDGVGRCSEFDPTEVMSSKDVRRSDRFTQLAIAAGAEALADAGWQSGLGEGGLPYHPTQIGCVIGTGIGGLGTMEAGHDTLRDRGAERVPPLSVPLMMTNAAAGVLAMRHGLRGQTFSVGSACAAGSHAIGVATRMIQAGDARAVVAGGSEAALTPLATAAFAAMDATSRSGISRPFDARRDGFVMGEGAGVLVLEDADSARARGARILGEVLGYAATSDAHHLTAPDPEGRGAADAIRGALRDAGLTPEEVDYVNAHGTSTPPGDRAETSALKTALGKWAQRIPVSSTKSAIGHLLGAAGAVEAVATVLALRERVAPPTLGYEQPDEGMDLDYVPRVARALPARQNGHAAKPAIGLSNSFGFGGHNAVLCLAGGV
jgi:3-oxoacyl-[acyl-carrier-protein] synthase II